MAEKHVIKVRKDWAIAGIILICGYTFIGFSGKLWVQKDKGIPNYGKTECIDLFFSGDALRGQKTIYDYASDKFRGQNIRDESSSFSMPFFRYGSIKLSFTDSEIDIKTISEVISSKFPGLGFEISQSET